MHTPWSGQQHDEVTILAISGKTMGRRLSFSQTGILHCMEAMLWLITSCMASWTVSWRWSAQAVLDGPPSEPRSAGCYRAQLSGPWVDFCLAFSATWPLLLVFCSEGCKNIKSILIIPVYETWILAARRDEQMCGCFLKLVM